MHLTFEPRFNYLKLVFIYLFLLLLLVLQLFQWIDFAWMYFTHLRKTLMCNTIYIYIYSIYIVFVKGFLKVRNACGVFPRLSFRRKIT